MALLAYGRGMASIVITNNNQKGLFFYFSSFSMTVSIFHVKRTECSGRNCIIPADAASFAHAWVSAYVIHIVRYLYSCSHL
jgi:hypothetical protein